MYQSQWEMAIIGQIRKLKVYKTADGRTWEISHLLTVIFIIIRLPLSKVAFIFLVRFLIFIDFLKIKFNLGGMNNGGSSNLVAKMDENGLDENIWTEMGRLLSNRKGHRSIVLNNKIVHIGGIGRK